MTDHADCQSCGMPISQGAYCAHCVDDKGELQTFEVRLENMSQWLTKSGKAASPADARQQALAHMATMPAWRDHPQLRADASN